MAPSDRDVDPEALSWPLVVRRGTAVAVDLVVGFFGGLALGLVVTHGIADAAPDLIPVGWWRVDLSLGVAATWWLVLETVPPTRQGRRRGQTVGKQLVRLRVQRVDGRRLATTQTLSRPFLRWIAALLSAEEFDVEARHDKWLRTKVVPVEPPARRL